MMKLRYIHILVIALLISPAWAFAQTAQLTVKVIVSPKIPTTDSLAIMGNQPAFGGWFDFSKGKMTRQDDTTFIYKTAFPVNTSLEFQITRGTWYKTAIYTYGRYEA